MSKPNVLFLADTTHQAGAVIDHIHATTASDAFHWHVLNPLSFKTIEKIDFSLFDAVGVHFSIKLHGGYYLSSRLKKKISAYTGFKFIFLQDEYQKVNETEALLYQLKFDCLFTLVRPELWDKAYPDTRLKHLKKIHVLTGYVDDAMKSMASPPVSERPLDVSYRSRRCDYRLGKLGQEKSMLASEFVKRTKNEALVLDISVEEADRVYGEAWFDLLMRSKIVLGTESGASIWDRDGRVIKDINRFLRKNPHATFDAVFESVLKPYEGNLLYNAISPRVFEAAATKTPMVMFVGDYSGVCKPDVHYIALKKDFSNLPDVLEKIKDTAYLQALADRAHADLIMSGKYAQDKLASLVQRVLAEHMQPKAPAFSEVAVSNLIESVQTKYYTLNKMKCLHAEVSFILSNFFRLLFFEPSGTWLSKMELLRDGVKRYIVYLNPRVKRT